jgi:DNA-binding transcriptional LysR family regulator
MEIGVSPGSLSKAISRLEEELKVRLFARVGRNIQLTDHGQFLKRKGHELLKFETSVKNEILGKENSFQVVIGGSELLLSQYGVDLVEKIENSYPSASFRFEVFDRDELQSRVKDGEVDLGITTYDISQGIDQINLSTVQFCTFVSKKHPLFRQRKNGKVSIAEVLKYRFVLPGKEVLGRISKSDSVDGWRDDKFPRRIGYTSSSVKSLEALIERGGAVSYLPEYFKQNENLVPLEIEDCPFSCRQKVRLITKNKKSTGWINGLF